VYGGKRAFPTEAPLHFSDFRGGPRSARLPKEVDLTMTEDPAGSFSPALGTEPPSAFEEGAGPLVLFDGVCNLCNASVSFIIERDPAARFRFAPMQSEAGGALLRRHGLSTLDLESMVLIEGGRCYTRSAAALRIARRLAWPWKLLCGLLAVPAPLRDALYNWVARNRYRWFGRSETCRLPTPELARRFLG